MTPIRSMFDRYLEQGKIRFVAATILLFSIGLLTISFSTHAGRATLFGPPLGADYAGFYVGGTMLNAYPPEKLYDLEVQDQVYHDLLPNSPPEEHLPYVHPPFVAWLFRPWARLPYVWSYGCWLGISALLFTGGLAVTRRSLDHFSDSQKWTFILVALSFEPFIMECWIGGQLSALGFLLLALALRAERREQPFLAGFFLGFCLYKPTLAVMLIPMLIVGRRWQALLGLIFSGMIVAGACVIAVGVQGTLSYIRFLLGYAHVTTGAGEFRPLWKFVDAHAFFKLLLGNHNTLIQILTLAAFLATGPVLLRLWWSHGRLRPENRVIIWSATITWTLLLNIYVGMYDTILAILGMAVTANFLLRRSPGDGERTIPAPWQYLFAAIYIVPWFSQGLARAISFQPYALALAALGICQLRLAWTLVSNRTQQIG